MHLGGNWNMVSIFRQRCCCRDENHRCGWGYWELDQSWCHKTLRMKLIMNLYWENNVEKKMGRQDRSRNENTDEGTLMTKLICLRHKQCSWKTPKSSLSQPERLRPSSWIVFNAWSTGKGLFGAYVWPEILPGLHMVCKTFGTNQGFMHEYKYGYFPTSIRLPKYCYFQWIWSFYSKNYTILFSF